LLLGDMGETHFVVGDEWQSRFLRKQAEEGVSSLTVRRLRAWMDQPEAMGLPRDIQNLVILSFALQTNLSFSLRGDPVEPRLENLDDELELREQPLPGEAIWQEALQRASGILGLVVSSLLHATNMAKLLEGVKGKAMQNRPEVERFCKELRQRLELFDIEIRTAPRLQTAQATLALLHSIAEADKDAVVDVLAQAHIATSAAAMGHVVEHAADLGRALSNTPWAVFDTLHQLPAERTPQAPAILEQVRQALTRDEHVVPLAEALQTAQSAALGLLASLVEPVAPAAPQREPSSVSPTPARLRGETSSFRHGIGIQDALALFDTLRQALEADANLLLDLDWRLYPKSRNP